MVSSRKISSSWSIGLAFTLAIVVLASAVSVVVVANRAVAFAEGAFAERQVPSYAIDVTDLTLTSFVGVSEEISLNEIAYVRGCAPLRLGAVTDPASIDVGKSCGMADMCGLDPCLCGASDAWGCCACNGLETISPTLNFSSSDESVVRVVAMGDGLSLLPVGQGVAYVTCNAEMIHCESGQASFEVVVCDDPRARFAGFIQAIAALVSIVVVVFVVVCGGRRNRARNAMNRYQQSDSIGKDLE